MTRWRIAVEDKQVQYPGSHGQRVSLYRDGELIARVYPVDGEEPGVQLYSDRLDFERGMRGVPDPDGGQVIHRVLIEPTEVIATAAVPGRWFSFSLLPEATR